MQGDIPQESGEASIQAPCILKFGKSKWIVLGKSKANVRGELEAGLCELGADLGVDLGIVAKKADFDDMSSLLSSQHHTALWPEKGPMREEQ